MQYIAYAQRGDYAACAEASFDCVACGMCSSRCPAQITHPMVSLLARRLYGKYIAPKSEHLAKRVQEIKDGVFTDAVNEIAAKPLAELQGYVQPQRHREKGRKKQMLTQEMLDSIKRVEASRPQRIGAELKRMSAQEKDELLRRFHPDYRQDGFVYLAVGPNKGDKVPTELGNLLHGKSRVLGQDVELDDIYYDTDVLIIGGGGAGASAAIEAENKGAKVTIVTKLRMGDANTMMAEGGIQAADKANDSPAIHYLDALGGGHFANKPELLKSLLPKRRTAYSGLTTWALCLIKSRTAPWSPLTAAAPAASVCMPAATIPARR